MVVVVILVIASAVSVAVYFMLKKRTLNGEDSDGESLDP